MYNYSTMTRADRHRHPWTTAHDTHARQDPLVALEMVLDEVDEAVGGGVVRGHGVLVLQLRLNGLGQLLAKLNAEMARSHQRVPKHAGAIMN